MKSLSRTAAQIGLAIVIGLAGLALLSAEEKPAQYKNNVVVSEDRIVLPATEMSKQDQKAMNRILKQFDKSLYKIEVYENGKLTKTRGELKDVITDKQLASEIADNVKKKGFTQYAVQILANGATPTASPGSGGGAHPQFNPTLPPPPPPPPKSVPTRGGGAGSHAQFNPNSLPPPPPPQSAAGPGGEAASHAQFNSTSVPPPPPPGGGSGAHAQMAPNIVAQPPPPGGGSGAHAQMAPNIVAQPPPPGGGSGAHAQMSANSVGQAQPPPPGPAGSPGGGAASHAQFNPSTLPPPPPPPSGPPGGSNHPQFNPNAITPAPVGDGAKNSDESMTKLKAILEKYRKK